MADSFFLVTGPLSRPLYPPQSGSASVANHCKLTKDGKSLRHCQYPSSFWISDYLKAQKKIFFAVFVMFYTCKVTGWTLIIDSVGFERPWMADAII